jgi:ATP-binding cassette subfamily F protein uup
MAPRARCRDNPSMSLISILDAHLAFGDRPLLDGAQFSMQPGERIGLIGRNGSGKSSLLRVLGGFSQLDDGTVKRRDGLAVTLVEQEPELPEAATLRESLLLRAHRPSGNPDDPHESEAHGERWHLHQRLTEYMQRFNLDANAQPQSCSGGERKRAALALALALDPDLLLLDEPTNHLDIEGIERLEDILRSGPAAIVITHDRAFLDRVTTRIVELDRGVLRSYPGTFSAYESRKEGELSAEALANRRFDRFWAQEEAWIRKGIEARRTRNEGRVKRLEHLREERAARRELPGNVKLNLDAGERSGKLVAELTEVSKAYDGRSIVKGLSMRVMRGDRIGVIGPNGAGKSTLLRLILDTLPPDSGHVRLGTNLQVAYFDQMREQLDPQATLASTISPGSDWVQVNGQARHVVSYLADFLFPSGRAQSPVRMLSGGERNRLLLARLFAAPANLLVLDEPTNDLDIESLELLEQTLQDYAGTLLLVSHDRAFLDNVVTQTLAPEGEGEWREYVGGYSDRVRQRPKPMVQSRASPARRQVPAREKQKTRLSFKERRELQSLPAEIEALEREQAELASRMSAPDYYREDKEGSTADRVRNDLDRAAEIEAQLREKFARWEALEQERSRLG